MPNLAELYGVPTKAMNQAVKRNARRFPVDFMFQLTVTPEEKPAKSKVKSKR
ncbi:ORF6N domain-containing protein [Oxalobacteraceae bacterium]|nr:ORF6N domain-containing protein [Oxalobacteraceae bacterium]